MQGKKVKTIEVLSSLFVRTYESGVLTLADRCIIRAILLSGSLSEEEQRIINRRLHAVRRNWIGMHCRTNVSQNYFVA